MIIKKEDYVKYLNNEGFTAIDWNKGHPQVLEMYKEKGVAGFLYGEEVIIEDKDFFKF